MKIIYDVGANNGDDIPYYLHKADFVVAIEANPVLSGAIIERFPTEVSAGRLVVESCAVTVDSTEAAVPFYIHKRYHVQSQVPRPPDDQIGEFEKIDVPSKSLISIINNYGTPHYIKIDVERYDKILLKGLFRHAIFPAYVSAESHEIEVFATFVSYGGYKAFKLVDGPTIPHVYGHHKISTIFGPIDYSFPDHSAGPFGNDIEGQWLTASTFFKVLADAGLGWKDIHVSNVDLPQA
jgi:FkbM family methyltransferase